MYAKNFIKQAFIVDSSITLKELVKIFKTNKIAAVQSNNRFLGLIDYNEILKKITMYGKDSIENHLLEEYTFFEEEACLNYIKEVISYKKQYEYPVLSDGRLLGFLDVEAILLK